MACDRVGASVTDDPDFYAPLPKYVPAPRVAPRPPRRRVLLMIVTALLAAGGVAIAVLAFTGSSSGTPSTAAGTPSKVPSSPPPSVASATGAAKAVGPLIAGTYLIGRDIPPGHYRAQHTDPSCAWAVVHENDAIVVDHAAGAPVTVTVIGTDKSLQVQGDCLFVRS